MHKHEEIISAIGENVINDSTANIDFSRASLTGSGKHCDVYRLRWHSRVVCVKKIKTELIANPLIRQALHKEFELGFSLNHPAIPRYLLEDNDFIVMDFVEGDTLLSLIQRKDPWLASPKNLICMMRNLLDALDYLHSRNIVHCDIKTDNVMITSGTHNAMLIDLGLAHTDWLDNTAGDPSRFGLEANHHSGNPNVDFHALAILAQRIGEAGYNIRPLKRFIRQCRMPDISTEKLRETLNFPQKRTFIIAAVGIAITIIFAIAALSTLKTDHSTQSKPLISTTDSTLRIDENANTIASPKASYQTVDKNITPIIDNNIETKPIDSNHPSEINFKTYISGNASGFFLQSRKQTYDYEQKIADGSAQKLSNDEIGIAINRLVDTYNSEYATALADLRNRFHNDNPTDIEIALASSDVHTDLLSRRQNVIQSLTNIIAARDGNKQ